MKKARAGGISSASFLDLKAELSKREEDFKKSKASGGGKAEPIRGGVKRDEKKVTPWLKKNKGVATRAAKDRVELELEEKTVESTRAALERKSKIYEKLQKGLTGGLNDRQYDSLLVDFDKKYEEGDHYSSDSDDADESLIVPRPPQENDPDDPMVEYQDEFGRTRTARKSEVPRDLAGTVEPEPEDDDPYVVYNPVSHFPTYEPTAEKIEAINAALDEARKDPIQHYDASKENRVRGAGFYNFSGDEETRQRQMDELKAARVDTAEKREETGADVKPVNPALEKRKRELEERKKLIDAKRRKIQEKAGSASQPSPQEP